MPGSKQQHFISASSINIRFIASRSRPNEGVIQGSLSGGAPTAGRFDKKGLGLHGARGGGGRSQWSQLRSRKVRQSKLKDLLSLSLTEQKIGKKAKKFGRIQVLYLSREWAPFILPSFRGASAASFVLAAPAASVGLYPVSRPRGPS